MKNRKLILLILASMALGALAGCSNKNNTSSNPTSDTTTSSEEDPMPAEYSLMKYWAGNASEEFYEVNDSGAQTIIEYEDVEGEDAGGWAYVGRSFQYDAAVRSRFTEYRKISFTGKLEKTSGSNVVMVKVQGAGGTFEKRFNFAATTGTYEFSTNFISDWNQVDAILFFANRSTNESGSGTITLDKIVLSKEAVNDEYDIAPGMPSVPQAFNYYDGEDSFNAMYRWGYNGDGYITTTEVTGGYKFSWTGNKAVEWSYVSAWVSGTEEHPLVSSGLKRVVYTITGGTAGQSALFKVEDYEQGNANAVEKSVEFTGEEQTIEIDITNVLANANFADKLKLLIFPLAGQQGDKPAGEVTLKSAVLDKTAVVVPEEKNTVAYTAIWMEKVAVKDDCYTIYNDEHLLTVDFNKTAPGYQSLLLKVEESAEWYVDATNVKQYNRIVGKIKSTVKVNVLLKPFDLNANEHWLNLEANVEQTVDFTVSEDTVDLTKAFAIFICAGDGEQATSGRVMFDGLRLVRRNANVGYDDDVVLNKTGGCDAAYTFSMSGEDLVADFEFASTGWHQIEMNVSAKNEAAYNEIVGTITSTVATTLLVKPQDNTGNETTINLAANTPYELDHKFANPLVKDWAKILMSVSTNNGDALTGKITFGGLTLKIDDPEKVSADPNPINLAGGYINNYSFASDCYKLRKIANGVKVVVENGKADGWENIQAEFTTTEDWFNLTEYTRVTAEVTATVDTNILIKPYNNGAFEHLETLTANETKYIDFTIAPAAADIANAMIVFIGTGGMAAGEVRIERFCVSRPTANLEKDNKLYISKVHFANPDDFEVTPKANGQGMTLAYHKVDGHDWEGIQIYGLANDLSQLKVLHIKGSASQPVHLKFKFDGPNEEKEIVITAAGNFDESVTFTNQLDGKWNKIIVFVAYDGGDAKTGTLELNEFYLGQE